MGIISSSSRSGIARSSTAASLGAAGSEEEEEESDEERGGEEELPAGAGTFRALPEGVGSHAEGGAQTFPVAEAGGFGGTLLHAVAASC